MIYRHWDKESTDRAREERPGSVTASASGNISPPTNWSLFIPTAFDADDDYLYIATGRGRPGDTIRFSLPVRISGLDAEGGGTTLDPATVEEIIARETDKPIVASRLPDNAVLTASDIVLRNIKPAAGGISSGSGLWFLDWASTTAPTQTGTLRVVIYSGHSGSQKREQIWEEQYDINFRSVSGVGEITSIKHVKSVGETCLLYTSPSPRDS